MKVEDKPIWYDVYAAFPPQLEPRYDRPAPNINVKQIFYEEDVIRAYVFLLINLMLSGCNILFSFLHRKYHKFMKSVGTVNLADNQYKSQTQLFIEAYKQIKSQGALDEDKIIEVAQDIVRDKMKERFESQKDSIGLVNSFSEATKDRKTSQAIVDVKSIFE